MTDYSSPQHQIEHSRRPVLADFYTSDCIPCRQMKPVIALIQKEYTGILKVISIDAGQYPDLIREYGIGSVPFIILFKEGRPVFEYAGFLSYKAMKDLLDRHL